MALTTLKNPLVVWVSDIHINLRVALCKPVVRLGEGDAHRASAMQVAIWRGWLDAWKEVWLTAGRRPVVVAFGGEIVDIDAKNRSHQYITRDPAEALAIGMEVLEPALKVGACYIVLRGTEAHVGKSGALDEAVAKQIHDSYGHVVPNEKMGQYSFWEERFFIGGRKFDLAHHVNMGSMPHTERNAANALSARLIMDYVSWNEPLPDFALRGHVHRWSDSGFNYPIRSIIGPSWSLPTTYVNRIGRGSVKPEFGLVLIDPATKQVKPIVYNFRRDEPILI